MDIGIYNKIIQKKEFSQLPKEDVEKAFEQFNKKHLVDEEKIKLTRDLLRKVFSVFSSGKLLNKREREAEWILRKHISTKERLDYYKELYKRIFLGLDKRKEICVFDLGCGVNGLSYEYMQEQGEKGINYFGFEAVGQIVNLANFYFKNNKLNARVYHESLFNISKVLGVVGNCKNNKIILMFKVVDSLEMVERDYSKKLLLGLRDKLGMGDKIIVSFATRSLVARKKFNVSRKWFEDFAKDNFNILDDFELGGERYFFLGM
jgi:SAM-dependent methyltransferase